MLITRPSHVSKETYSVSIGRFLISYSILDISLSLSRNFCLASPTFSIRKATSHIFLVLAEWYILTLREQPANLSFIVSLAI